MHIRYLASGTLMAVTAAAPAWAQPAPKADPLNRQFAYFLPRTAVGAVITQRLVECPRWRTNAKGNPVETPVLVTAIAAEGEVRADPDAMFTVDARAGFLARRSTKFALRPDGTLETFNVTSEGQGGEVLNAVIGAAAKIATWGTPASVIAPSAPAQAISGKKGILAAPPRPPALRCTAKVEADLRALKRTVEDIAVIEARMVAGTAGPAEIRLLESRQAEEKKLLAALTLSAGRGESFDPHRDDFKRTPEGVLPLLQKTLPAPRYETWFERWDPAKGVYVPAIAANIAPLFDEVPGAHGFLVALAVDRPMYDRLAGQPLPDARTAQRFVHYRRPVPVTLSVKPCAARTASEACVGNDRAPSDTRTAARFALPQLSELYSVSIGKGGLFGSREATVKLDASGAPIVLEYGSAPGSASMAKVVDASAAAGNAIRGAQTAADLEAIEAIEARNKLRELLAADAAAPGTN